MTWIMKFTIQAEMVEIEFHFQRPTNSNIVITPPHIIHHMKTS
jgi:hypothetical protein